MPSAELSIKTTHDGTQAERSLARLEASIERLGKSVSGRIAGAFAGLFSVEKIIQFGRSIDTTLTKTAELVDKIREGKATMDELQKTGLSQESAGFASRYKRFKDESLTPFIEETKARIGRGLIGASPAANPIAGLAFVFNKQFQGLVKDAVTPQASRITEAFDAGNVERERQSTIEYIQRMSGETPLGKNQPKLIEMVQVQRSQLEELKRISRQLNPSAAKLLDRDSMFPN